MSCQCCNHADTRLIHCYDDAYCFVSSTPPQKGSSAVKLEVKKRKVVVKQLHGAPFEHMSHTHVAEVAVSADNSTVYTVARGGTGANLEINNGVDGAITAWDLVSGSHTRTVVVPLTEGAIAIVPCWDGRLIVLGGGTSGEPDEFDIAFAEAAGLPPPSAGTANELYIFTQDLRRMATPSSSGDRCKITAIAACSHNEVVYAGTETGELLVWSFQSDEAGVDGGGGGEAEAGGAGRGDDVLCLESTHQIHYDQQRVQSLTVAADGTVYALSSGESVGGPATAVYRPTIATYTYGLDRIGTFASFEARVEGGKPTAMVAVGDGWLFTGHANGEIKIWSEGECTRTMSHHTQAITSLAASFFGTVFSGSLDGTVQAWSSRGRRVRVHDTEPHPVLALAVSQSSDIYSAVQGSNMLRVW